MDLEVLSRRTVEYSNQQTIQGTTLKPLTAAKHVVAECSIEELQQVILSAPEVWILKREEYEKVANSGDETRIQNYAAILIIAKLYDEVLTGTESRSHN